MAYIMEGISLFGTTPSFRAIPAGGFVISASRIAGETPPVVGGDFVTGETHVQSLVVSPWWTWELVSQIIMLQLRMLVPLR